MHRESSEGAEVMRPPLVTVFPADAGSDSVSGINIDIEVMETIRGGASRGGGREMLPCRCLRRRFFAACLVSRPVDTLVCMQKET